MSRKYVLGLLLVLGSIPLLWFIFTSGAGKINTPLKKGEEFFNRAKTSKSLIEYSQNVNSALSNYLQAESELRKRVSTSALLDENIANSLYLLEEYPLAVFYYSQALKKSPRNLAIRNQLNHAQALLGMPVEAFPSRSFLFFLQNKFSLNDKMLGFLIFWLIATGCASAAIWFPRKWLVLVTGVFGIWAFLFIISAFYTHFIAPIHAIVIKPTLLFKEASAKSAAVTPKPVFAGSSVHVTDLSSDAQWLKVVTEEGNVGYISTLKARVVEL